MNASQSALMELVDKIERLGQFQDRVEFPAGIERIWEVFLDDVLDVLSIEGCALFRVDDATQEFHLAHLSPEPLEPVFRQEFDFQVECGIFPWVIRRSTPSLVPSSARRQGSSVIMLPLSTARRTLGVAMVLTAIQESQITQEKMRLLSVLGRQCALVMENNLLFEDLRRQNAALERTNKQVEYLSQRDPLTGCYNRRYMNEHLPREIRRARRYRRALSLALCDIDHFKRINDTYGHAFGDSVLQQFVKSLNELIRTDSDWLVRYGGEEFLLVLPETALANAVNLAERLRGHIAAKSLGPPGEEVRVTASFGVIGCEADQAAEKVAAENLLRFTDANLYRAKNEGRNRVVASRYTSNPAPPPA